MGGNFADVTTPEGESKVNRVTRWYKPWFYKHVETFLETGEGEEYIPLREYLLRHVQRPRRVRRAPPGEGEEALGRRHRHEEDGVFHQVCGRLPLPVRGHLPF